MNSVAFIFALLGLLLLTVFIYINYPKQWRRHKFFNVVLIIFHVLGTLSLAGIFVVYKRIPYEWIKWGISRIGSIYYVVILYLAILFGVRIVARFIYVRAKRAEHKQITVKEIHFLFDRRVHSTVFLVIAFGIAFYGFYNIGNVRVTEYDVEISKHCDRDSLNVVFFADTHCGAGTWSYTYDKLEKEIRGEAPDIILIGGDVFDETTSEKDIEYFRKLIQSVDAPLGIYYIYGNHDDNTDDYTARLMREMGVQVLEDEMVTVDGIQLIGRLDPVDDQLSLDELMNKVDKDDSLPTIMLTHRPEKFKEISDAGCDLALAGHTHGFNIPQFMGRNIAYDMYYGRKDYNGMTAITTSGVSAWGFHYKFPAKSEIVSLHITFGD